MKEYYHLLGLKPGAGPDEIKKAFREQIKLCHPDRSSGESDKARALIEAYNYLKENHASYREESYSEAVHYQKRSSREDLYYQAGKEAGERLFRGVFRDRQPFTENLRRPPVEDVFDPLVFLRKRKESSLPLDKGEMMLYRAEIALREVIQKYNRQMKTRSKQSWSRDYISKLVNVQVLFRDVTVRHPGLSVQARSRLKQIQELIAEIKLMA